MSPVKHIQKIEFAKDFLFTNRKVFGDYRDIFYYAFEMPFFKRDRPNGVYLLGDFYVGKSIDYAARVLGHKTGIKSALQGYSTSGNTSADGAINWLQRHKNRCIPVFHMSDNQKDEYEIARDLINEGFPIVNDIRQCDGYYNFHMTEKEIDSVRYLRELGYWIEIPGTRTHLITTEN